MQRALTSSRAVCKDLLGAKSNVINWLVFLTLHRNWRGCFARHHPHLGAMQAGTARSTPRHHCTNKAETKIPRVAVALKK